MTNKIDPTTFGLSADTIKNYEKVGMIAGFRRDLDIRPFAMIAGLKIHNVITEVYRSSYGAMDLEPDKKEELHRILSIPKGHSSLDFYVGSGSTEINHDAWEHYKERTPFRKDVREHIDNIDKLLLRKTSVPDGTRVFTGLPESPITKAGFEWNASREKKILHLPSYTSTTTDFSRAEWFTEPDHHSIHHESDHHGVVETGARHILEINFDKHIHGAASVRGHTPFNSHENEILLARGQELILHPRPTKVTNHNGIHPIYVWHAHQGLKLPYQYWDVDPTTKL
jgi:ADP-ribosyltransferase exoenzyme